MLILFASGDAGYLGVSGDIIEHLALEHYYLVTYDARQLIAREKKSRTRAKIQEVAALYDTILVDARHSLGIPDSVPMVVIGYSRGAQLVVLSAGIQSLRHHLAGAIAVALCPKTDYIEKPTPKDPLSSVAVDEKGHIQTYAAIPLGRVAAVRDHPGDERQLHWSGEGSAPVRAGHSTAPLLHDRGQPYLQRRPRCPDARSGRRACVDPGDRQHELTADRSNSPVA